MRHYITALATLAASCTYAPAFAEQAYKEVTCVATQQAQSLLKKFNARQVYSFKTELGFALVVETPADDVLVLEFIPKQNLACLILDGKKHKGA